MHPGTTSTVAMIANFGIFCPPAPKPSASIDETPCRVTCRDTSPGIGAIVGFSGASNVGFWHFSAVPHVRGMSAVDAVDGSSTGT
jgi:hypothetical protein